MWGLNVLRTPWVLKLMSASVLIGAIAVSYSVTTAWWPQSTKIHRSDVKESTPLEIVNPFASAKGAHLVAYFFTASDCGWSRLLSQGDTVKSMSEKLHALRGTSYAEVTVVGVALDKDLTAGLEVLARLGKGRHAGAFDQLMVGGSWLNEQIVRLAWRDGVLTPALPQVFLIERTVDTDVYLSEQKILVGDERVVGAFRGEREITMWKDSGFAIAPQSDAKTALRGEPTGI